MCILLSPRQCFLELFEVKTASLRLGPGHRSCRCRASQERGLETPSSPPAVRVASLRPGQWPCHPCHPPGSARLGFTPNSSRGHQPKAGDAQGWTCSLFLEADAFRKGSRRACLSVWGPTSPRSRASSAALPLEGHEKVLAVLSGSRTRQGDPASWPLRLPLLITPVATAGRVRRMKGAPPGAADRSY